MTEENLKKYLESGGEIFRVTKIDTYRDGGTKEITTTKGRFYVHKKYRTFHTGGYSTTGDNLVKDDLLIEYLLERIEKYLDMTLQSYKYDLQLLKELKEIHDN